MKKMLAVVGALFGLSASAAAAEVQFIGGLTISAQAGTCPLGKQVGDVYVARFRPRNTSLGTSHSDLNLFDQGFALGHRLFNATFTSTFQKVQATTVAGGSGSTPVTASTTFIKFTQAPAAIGQTTRTVSIEGQIKGFDGQPQCTVSFVLSGARRFDF